MSALTEPFEKAALRVLKAARTIFEDDERGVTDVPQTSAGVLRAALVCASADIDMIGQAQASMQEPVEDYVMVRAQHRITLALELADFYDQFGPNHDEEPAVRP